MRNPCVGYDGAVCNLSHEGYCRRHACHCGDSLCHGRGGHCRGILLLPGNRRILGCFHHGYHSGNHHCGILPAGGGYCHHKKRWGDRGCDVHGFGITLAYTAVFRTDIRAAVQLGRSLGADCVWTAPACDKVHGAEGFQNRGNRDKGCGCMGNYIHGFHCHDWRSGI